MVQGAGSGTVTATHVFAAGGTYTVEVCVTDDDGGMGCDALALSIPVPILTATKTYQLADDVDGDGLVEPGDAIGYTITVNNSGPAAATGVVLTDPIPAHTELVAGSVTTTQGTIDSQQPVQVSLGEIGAGSSAGVTFQVRIVDSVQSVWNQGQIASVELPAVLTDDPSRPGSADITLTPIILPPTLSARKQVILASDVDGDGLAGAGDVLAYAFIILHTGEAADNVMLRDEIPEHTTLVPGSVQAIGGTLVSEDPLEVDFGTLQGNRFVVFLALIDASLPAGVDEVVNQGTLTADGDIELLTDDPALPGDADPTVMPLAASPEPVLQATKVDELAEDSDGDGLPSPGDVLRYTIAVSNAGGGAATGVTLTDLIPANTSVVAGSVTTTAGTVLGEDPVQVDAGDINAGATVTVSFEVRISDSLPSGTDRIVNQGTVTSDQLPAVLTDDPDLGGDADPTETTIAAAPDLVAEKTDALFEDADSNGVPSPGDVLEYTLTIFNNGNASATAVVLEDPIPEHTTLVAGSVTTDRGTVESEDPVIVSIGELAGGMDSVTVSFRVTVDDPIAAGVPEILNQGLVSSAELADVLTDDPDLGGDADPTATAIQAEPILTVEKVDVLFEDTGGDGVASPGDVLLYQLSVGNDGNTAATGVVLNDAIPEHTVLEAGSVQTSQGTILGEDPLEIALDQVDAGVTATGSCRVRIDDPFPAGVLAVANQAVASSAGLADVASDDPALPGDADPPGAGTIVDDDPLPQLSIDDVTLVEGDAGTTQMAFTISLSPISGRQVTVEVATAILTPAAAAARSWPSPAPSNPASRSI